MESIDMLRVFKEQPLEAIKTLAAYPLTSGNRVSFNMFGEGVTFASAASYSNGDPGILLGALCIPLLGVTIKAGVSGIKNYQMRDIYRL